MILIVGGYKSGQAEYARTHYGQKERIEDFHLKILEWMEAGKDPYQEARQYYTFDGVITGDEIGSGIVPLEKKEREYREVTGRIFCELARHSERMIRTICGLGSVLK